MHEQMNAGTEYGIVRRNIHLGRKTESQAAAAAADARDRYQKWATKEL